MNRGGIEPPRETASVAGLSETKSGASLAVNSRDFALRNPDYARSFPAHAGIQTGSPHSQGRAEIYGLLCNPDAAVQPRKDSHGVESLD